MRILISFLIGFLGFFFISEGYTRLFKKPPNSKIGISIIVIGFIVGVFGRFYLDSPVNVLLSLFLIGTGLGLMFHHLLSRRYIISERVELEFARKHETKIERALEILPGALTWTALTSPIWLSFTYPFAVAYLIIIADAYWLISALKNAVLIVLGYRKMKWAISQPWLEKLKEDFPDSWDQYHHVVLLPTYKESIQVLQPAFEAVANSNYPKQKIFLSVGFEAWADQTLVSEIIEQLEQYKKKIGDVFVTIHELQPGEIKGPGTNRNCMYRNAVEQFKKLGIPENKVIVTTLDADFVIHKEFLSGALHKYLSTTDEIRDKRSFTGSFFYYNNYWQAPTPMRLISTGTALWQLAEMYGSDKYMNFSSLSINLKSLKEIGGWIPNKINDDSGFYWKAYFHFKGDYKVIPHYLPITGDTNLDTTLWKTFVNQYQQLKRWAYGVEHIPYAFKEYFRRSDIDFWDKTDKLLFVLWGNLRWGSLALIVTFAGVVIPYINPVYAQSVVAINLPIISSWILTAAFLGLFATIYVQEKTVPPRPKNWSLIQRLWSYLQYLLVPVILVTISTVPAIDAQTSLMFGRYLEYRVTNKARLA
jgi:hypothetical protein